MIYRESEPIEFERFRNEAGHNYFGFSPHGWAEGCFAGGTGDADMSVRDPYEIITNRNIQRQEDLLYRRDGVRSTPDNFSYTWSEAECVER